MAYPSGHKYSKKIPINEVNHGAALTDYSILLKVGETSGASGEDFDVGGKCLDFPDDIKFYGTEDSETELDYALLDLTGGDSNRLAIFRVKVPHDINGAGTENIYCRYRLSGDEMEDSWPDTFIAGDDFDFKWTPAHKQIHDCVNVPGVGVFMCTRNSADTTGYIMKYTLDGEETVKQLNTTNHCVKRVMGGCYDSTNDCLWWACLDAPDGETGQTADRASLIKMNPSDMSYEVFACDSSTYWGCACCTDGSEVWMVTQKDSTAGKGRIAAFDIEGETFSYDDQNDDYNFYWCIYAHSTVWIAAVNMADFDHADARGVLVEYNPGDDGFTRHEFGDSNEYSGPHHIANDGEDIWLVCNAGIGGRRYVRWARLAEPPAFDLYQLPVKAGACDIFLVEYDSTLSDYLWMTTYITDGGQLWRITKSDGVAKYVSETIDFPHGICFDDKHRIWLGNYVYPVNTAVAAQRISMPVSGQVLESSGTHTYDTDNESGIARLLTLTAVTNAGIVVTKDALADKNFAVRNRVKAGSIGTGRHVYFLTLAQRSGQPVCGTVAAEGGYRRIVVRQYSNGSIYVFYWDDEDTIQFWDEDTEWTEDASVGYAGAVNTYYIVKLISNATNWKIRIEDDSENLLQETDAVAWAATKDDTEDWWVYYGVVFTDADFGSTYSKEFYIRKHPSTGTEPTLGTIGEEEEVAFIPTVMILQ